MVIAVPEGAGDPAGPEMAADREMGETVPDPAIGPGPRGIGPEKRPRRRLPETSLPARWTIMGPDPSTRPRADVVGVAVAGMGGTPGATAGEIAPRQRSDRHPRSSVIS